MTLEGAHNRRASDTPTQRIGVPALVSVASAILGGLVVLMGASHWTGGLARTIDQHEREIVEIKLDGRAGRAIDAQSTAERADLTRRVGVVETEAGRRSEVVSDLAGTIRVLTVRIDTLTTAVTDLGRRLERRE